MYSNFALISTAWSFGNPVKKKEAGNGCHDHRDLNLKLSP